MVRHSCNCMFPSPHSTKLPQQNNHTESTPHRWVRIVRLSITAVKLSSFPRKQSRNRSRLNRYIYNKTLSLYTSRKHATIVTLLPTFAHFRVTLGPKCTVLTAQARTDDVRDRKACLEPPCWLSQSTTMMPGRGAGEKSGGGTNYGTTYTIKIMPRF